MTSVERSDETTFLWFDAAGERGAATLRLAAAGVVGLSATWLAFSDPGKIGGLFAAVGWLVSLGWLASFRRARKRLRDSEGYYLALGRDGLQIAQGNEPVHISWREVTGTEVDEERLVVRVWRGEKEAFTIEPMWQGLGVYDLHDAIVRARMLHGPPVPSGRCD